jgi:Skp family chaperone for outer membrane proteins
MIIKNKNKDKKSTMTSEIPQQQQLVNGLINGSTDDEEQNVMKSHNRTHSEGSRIGKYTIFSREHGVLRRL